MHILIIPSEEFSPDDKPTAGIFQLDQANVLSSKNNKVGVLSFRFLHTYWSLLRTILGILNERPLTKRGAFKLLIKKIINPSGIDIFVANRNDIQVFNNTGFWAFKRARDKKSLYNLWLNFGEKAFKAYIKVNGKPAVIHAHNMIYGGILGHYLSNKYQIPLVITEHSSAFARKEIKNNFLLERLKSIYQFDHKFTAVSPSLIEILSKYFSPKNEIEYLSNVLDPTFEKANIVSKEKTSPFIFLSIGDLIPLKGHKELIEAFYIAFMNEDEVKLKIGGSGYLEEELNDLIEELSLTKRVGLIGQLTREEVKLQMDDANAFLLPSHYETFGVVLIEALSRGLPVISTFCGGPESIVNEKNGLLVAPKSIGLLAEAMKKIKENYNRYSNSEIREMTINKFGTNAFYGRVMNIYNQAINDYHN